jgi:hypothetical protein
MNPALKLHKNGGEDKMAPPRMMGRDRTINQTVIIKKGGYKGLLGIVKDTTDTHARVELHTKGKTVTVPKTDLAFKNKITGETVDFSRGGPRPGQQPRSGGGRPGASDWQGGRTPIAASGSERTPAWGGGGGSRSKFFHLLDHLVMLTDILRSTGIRWRPHTCMEVGSRPVGIANSRVGGWLANGQPLRRQPHGLWLGRSDPGVAIRLQDAGR